MGVKVGVAVLVEVKVFVGVEVKLFVRVGVKVEVPVNVLVEVGVGAGAIGMAWGLQAVTTKAVAPKIAANKESPFTFVVTEKILR